MSLDTILNYSNDNSHCSQYFDSMLGHMHSYPALVYVNKRTHTELLHALLQHDKFLDDSKHLYEIAIHQIVKYLIST